MPVLALQLSVFFEGAEGFFGYEQGVEGFFEVQVGGGIRIGIICLGSQNHCPLVAVCGYKKLLYPDRPAPGKYEFIQYEGAKNRYSKKYRLFCVRVLFHLAPYYYPLINTSLSVHT